MMNDDSSATGAKDDSKSSVAAKTSSDVAISAPTAAKTSPRKPGGGKIKIDPTASLAAISAKLSTCIPPAESEISRIKREVLSSLLRRKEKVDGGKFSDGSNRDAGAGADANDDSTDDYAPDETSPTARGFHRGDAKLESKRLSSEAASLLHDSVIAEEWVNVHLETSSAYLLPATDIDPLFHATEIADGKRSDDAVSEEDTFAFRRTRNANPLARAGIDRFSLYRLGMSKDLVDRLFRALYVYTNGFHNLINEIAAHCPPRIEKHVSSNVWLTFLLLLEQCENGKYEMAMLKFKHATEEWRKHMEEDYANEKLKFDAQMRALEFQVTTETARSAEKSLVIEKLAIDLANANQTIVELQIQLGANAEQIRLLKLELLEREHAEKQLNEQLDDARKDYEISNSERINAMAEKYTLEDEIQKLHAEIERSDSEKNNFAKRMHETLFMNQALRANNEALKQNAVVVNLDKEKLVSEKLAIQEQLDQLRIAVTELKNEKTLTERELADSQRKNDHVEARLQTMKEQFELEVENNSKQLQEVAQLTALVDEEKAKAGVLEAKCNLMTAEKQSTGMRAQDKLRIERLLNQKLELDNLVEAMKLDKTKDQEQIWNLRASLEALDTEMQHSKRVFSAGQQAFLHSERTCEQLRHQLHDVEKNYEKSSKGLSSLRERFKLFEESSKEQITKLEVELKVTSAQLREVTYVNRDNATQIVELTKSLEVATKESKSLKTRLDASDQELTSIKTEKEELQRDKKQRDLQTSTSKNAFLQFIGSVQHMLALVKVDEYPLDEALRELLRLIKETFGEEYGIGRLLADEDEAEDFEEDWDEQDIAEEHERRRQRRRQAVAPDGLEEETDEAVNDDDDEDGIDQRRTQTTRMSRFRKSKLDKIVARLQKEVALKAELIQSLQSVVCEQTEQLQRRERVIARHEQKIALFACHKGMLSEDVDATAWILRDVRDEKAQLEKVLDDVRIELARETTKAFHLHNSFEASRHQYSMQCLSYEDLLCKIWREYEHYLYMLSLRRDEAVQATVAMTNQISQTLVPQRNSAMDRPRVAPMIMPSIDPTASTCESLIDQINKATRTLLPGVARDVVDTQLQLDSSQFSGGSSPRSGRLQKQNQPDSATYHGQGSRRNMKVSTTGMGDSALPNLPHAKPPQIIRHVNEFGMRQDILVSPVYPPYFPESNSVRTKGPARKRPQRPGGSPRRHRPARSSDDSALDSGREMGGLSTDENPGVRYRSGLLQAGMEVLRGGGKSPRNADHDRYELDDDSYDDDESDSDSSDPADRRKPALRSPSRLETALRAKQAREPPQAARRRRYMSEKDDDVRMSAQVDEWPEDSSGYSELSSDAQSSPFVPAVLYPLLPHQPRSSATVSLQRPDAKGASR